MDNEWKAIYDWQQMALDTTQRFGSDWVARSGIHLELRYPTAEACATAKTELVGLGFEVLNNGADRISPRVHRVFKEGVSRETV